MVRRTEGGGALSVWPTAELSIRALLSLPGFRVVERLASGVELILAGYGSADMDLPRLLPSLAEQSAGQAELEKVCSST